MIDWEIFLIVSVVVFCLSLAGAFVLSASTRRRALTPFRFFFVGTSVSVYLAWLPITSAWLLIKTEQTTHTALSIFQTATESLLYSIKTFSGGSEISKILEALPSMQSSSDFFVRWYAGHYSFLALLCPLLSIGFILSFFRNLSATAKYLCSWRKNIYAFSELNERSLALAADIGNSSGHKSGAKKVQIVFCSVKSVSAELLRDASKIGAICFQKDIVSAPLRSHSKKSMLNLFLLSSSEDKNTSSALLLMEAFCEREKTSLYVFSEQYESELMLTNKMKHLTVAAEKEVKITVRRINEAQSLVYNELYQNGVDLIYRHAHAEKESDVRKITVLLIGLGRYGSEMLRALTWYCQMDGYELHAHVFDPDLLAEARFAAACPDLMSEQRNGKRVHGEEFHAITFHAGISPNMPVFADEIRTVTDVSYIFVDMGSDEENIKVSLQARSAFPAINDNTSVIRTVLLNKDKASALSDIRNFNGNAYQIGYIDITRAVYSKNCILPSDLENIAQKIHTQWIGNNLSETERAEKEQAFWLYEYNYRSSLASAIHKFAYCELKLNNTSGYFFCDPEETGRLEHCRWNAYMRSEGFVSPDPDDRIQTDYIAKKHRDLTDYETLRKTAPEETVKDQRIEEEGLKMVWETKHRKP